VAVAEPLPASVANMIPEPAPPVPVLDPVAPPPSTVKPELQRKPDAQRKPAATTVATLDIPGAATGAVPALQDRAQIERVAGLYRGNPGTVRVVGYAAGPAGGGAGADPLASYHAALERAQTVAKALTEAGIPASKIQTEASPASGARAPGRVEIQLAQ
jgi:outer membrane protein OmpA-like peptidoglycan-associated protein